jgi:Leucine-rich repeat (LRR) protein
MKYSNKLLHTDAVILDLSRNQFTSNISRRISALNQLQALVLDENYLSGDVPLDQMANLQQLEIVSLANNRALQGSLEQMLTMWPHLVELNVATTEISGSIPTQIGLLTNLQSLEMWHADLTGALPTELGNLKQLRKYE